MRKERRKVEGFGVRLSLTSMIDVVFLLLIFFLCAPFKSPEGELDANMPKDEGVAQGITVPSTPLELKLEHVKRGVPRMLLGFQPIPQERSGPDFEWLVARLSSTRQRADDEVKVRIDADAKVHYGYVVATINACAKAGIRDIRFSSRQL